MEGLIEKVTGIAIVSVLILLFIINVFTPFKNNQQLMADTNNQMLATLQAEVEKASDSVETTPQADDK